jgi:RecJ-like exonuclease
MELKTNEIEFLERCEEAKRIALSFSDPIIIHHYDCDGISAGAIAQSAFKNANKRYQTKWIKKLDDSAIEELMDEPEIIFCDLGGGNKRVNELKDVLIIDHHQTEGVNKLQVNPLLHGIDGGTELSSSGAAYFVFRNDVDVAITGAVGDMQSPFIGMNRLLLEEGVKRGAVAIENDLKFYGRYSRPLLQFLLYSDDPYVPGISYNEEGAKRLLGETGVELLEKDGNPLTYGRLSNESKTKLISALANALIDKNMINKAEELIGESYVFPERGEDSCMYEANEFSTLLNACGRHNKAEIGVGVCMGDDAAYLEANALLQYHRKKIREGIDFAKKNIQDFGKFLFIDGRGTIDEGLIGIICGMVVNPLSDKPILGISLGENNDIKVSSRGTKRLISSGLNLGLAIKEVTGGIGGVGGGHRIAAGAAIPREKLGAFLEEMGKELDKQRNFQRK